MKKRMETIQDLIEEAKVRTVFWAICVFAITYFLSHTSKSMWTNLPISILILCGFRYLSYEVELRWKVRPPPKETYLSHLEKKQLSIHDSRLYVAPSTSKWKRKIDSPLVEAAIDDFIKKILQDFVIDLWYSSITPDKEAPELIHGLIFDALGEISGRIKEINLIDLLTRDVVDLIGHHLDLYRKYQSEIGVDVMGTLSFEERDETLKRHLMASKELHPALISPECEYKVLQRIVGGILAVVLKPREANSPLVRCFSREFLTCLVIQPLLNFASPGYINELIEYIFQALMDNKGSEVGLDTPTFGTGYVREHVVPSSDHQSGEFEPSKTPFSLKLNDSISIGSGGTAEAGASEHGIKTIPEDSPHRTQPRSAEWAVVLEAATKRRSEVLAPENLENMWTKGRNYQKKSATISKAGTSSKSVRISSGAVNASAYVENRGKETMNNIHTRAGVEDKHIVHRSNSSTQSSLSADNETNKSQDLVTGNIQEGHFGFRTNEDAREIPEGNKLLLKRSTSTPDMETKISVKSSDLLSPKEPYIVSPQREEPNADIGAHRDQFSYVPKVKCRVVGAYFEKLGSKSFAVYSIAVTDAENKSWFVKRRYRNFERLHRHLKDIPNYTLYLPPKRFLSSSIDDYFVHQRCILLDKYLQDLLSIANIAEQHEVWDFLSESSKNYSFGKSTSVLKTLAVNVDDAMDDIVRQFKGVSDGLRHKAAGPSPSHTTSAPIVERTMTLSWNADEKISPSYSNLGTSQSLSDEDAHDDSHASEQVNGWHSDNELNSKGFPPRVVKHNQKFVSHGSRTQQLDFLGSNQDSSLSTRASNHFEDLPGMPPEWTPANVSVPLLNLVDKVFQLNRRGWLRRQVFWISKQILQLMMEDAIDDLILRQIHWLRSEEVVAQAIRWVQDILWPDGTFFIKLGSSQGRLEDISFSQRTSQITRRSSTDKSSFELQLEAARRASDIKKMLFDGAPPAVVSLIGHKQYRRSARDIYYFTQSTICLKQLAFSILELVLVSVFPELKDVIRDIHEKTHAKSA